MKTFIADIIPKIQRFSQNLDNQTLLTNQHWVVLDEVHLEKMVYIFRSNNQLLISKNGKVEKGRWEIIGSHSILIDLATESYLFKHGFFDQNILALKLDGKNEYAILINENKYAGELNSLDKVIDFLHINYSNKSLPKVIKQSGYLKYTEEKTKRIGLQMNKIKTPQGVLFVEGVVYSLVGRKIYKNLQKEPAEDGKYQVSFMSYLHVKNGKAVKTTYL